MLVMVWYVLSSDLGIKIWTRKHISYSYSYSTWLIVRRLAHLQM
jgi:hypothetical protein